MPEQLEFSFGKRFEKPLPTPEEIVDEWLKEPAPLVHVYGQNPHIVRVTTLRSYEEPVWLNRGWVEDRLKEAGYKPTHSLTCGEDKALVYRPFNRRKKRK